MKIRIPIYQMIFDAEGIKFPNEVDDDSNQAVIFVIKKSYKGIDIRNVQDIIVYFPFDLNDEYFELESKIENSMVSFYPPKMKIKVDFEIDFENKFFNSINMESTNLRYVGNFEVKEEENSFLIIHPINLREMDRIYFQTKGIFVGLTPTFGDPEKDVLDF